MTVNVLGTKYSIHYKSPSEDKFLRGYGDFVTQQFYPCIGEACVGYHVGICLRAHEALKEVKEDECTGSLRGKPESLHCFS